MNVSSLLPTPASSGPQSAGPVSGSKPSNAFDALVTAKAGAADASNALPSLPDEPKIAGAAEKALKEVATVSAATMAMLATLDRSATMLSPSEGADLALGKDEKPVPTDAASTADAARTPPLQQMAVLISAFVAAGRASPTLVSLPEDDTPETKITTLPTSSAPKAALPTPLATTVPMPVLFNAIVAELRPMLGARADVVGTAIDASLKTGLASSTLKTALPMHLAATVPISALFHAVPAELHPTFGAKDDAVGIAIDAAIKPAKDSADGIPMVLPTSAMIRDLASAMANSVGATPPADGIAVDRHLDLARSDAWLNDLANDIAATATNGGRLKFGLAPESLGRLDVEIRQTASGVNVHMTTRTDTARDVLTAAQPRIIDEIRAQGVRVAGTEVSTDASGSGAGFGGGHAGGAPHKPLGLSIEAALSLPHVVPSDNPKAVVDGRYA